jgi:type IV pilus assembly protein PilA
VEAKKMCKRQKGFTLIELMIVMAILSILATMALPSFQDRVIRSQVQEALNLSEIAQKSIEDYYTATKTLPENNVEAGLPSPEKIIGNYVTGVDVRNGVIDVHLGNKINKHAEKKIVSIRPAIVEGEPVVPITWIHGYASVPKGMTVVGENRSDILPRLLPISCRY